MNKTFKKIITNDISPHLEYYFNKVYNEKLDIVIDGERGFNQKDFFVGGKVVYAGTYVVENMDKDNVNYERYINKLLEIIKLTSNLNMQTWGYLYYLKGLYRLKKEKLFSRIPQVTLDLLIEKLDWRNFVDYDDYSLMNKPTNYYGVAFGIARYRYLLGWEEESYSIILFDKLMKHIDEYSGYLGYMDETKGEGRFDRYSMLIGAEICELAISTGFEVTEKLLEMLKRTAKIYLNIANVEGHGYQYGRSIGTYGDTSALQVLSIAARLGVINEEDKLIAYNYNLNTVIKYSDFWLDSETRSLNMWDKGRKTDAYRHKGRILGENLSTCMQIIESYENWQAVGNLESFYSEDFEILLKSIPRNSFYKFQEDEYDRGLAIIRDGNHVFSLPLINGGGGTNGDKIAKEGFHYYCATPYLPIPNEVGLLESSPDTMKPQLISKLTLEDGIEVMPVSYTKNIQVNSSEDSFEVSYEQDEMCMLGMIYPRRFPGVKVKIKYTFLKGMIEKKEIFTIDRTVNVREINMEFASYSRNPRIEHNNVFFDEGCIYEMKVEGLDVVKVGTVEDNVSYHTPNGPLKTMISYKKDKPFNNIIIVKWKLRYKQI